MLATVATLDPLTAPNAAQAKMVATARPPGTRRNIRWPKRNRSSATPLSLTSTPIARKNGITTRTYRPVASSERRVKVTSASAKPSVSNRPTTPAMMSPSATGVRMASSTNKITTAISAAVTGSTIGLLSHRRGWRTCGVAAPQPLAERDRDLGGEQGRSDRHR